VTWTVDDNVDIANSIAVEIADLQKQLADYANDAQTSEALTAQINSLIAQAKALVIDTVVIGECQQSHYNIARENNINVNICIHYVTETFGVEAIDKEVSQKFSLLFEFFPTDCPL
jgi:putative NIF3 family GTP cyclohydrolase 1 type 2